MTERYHFNSRTLNPLDKLFKIAGIIKHLLYFCDFNQSL